MTHESGRKEPTGHTTQTSVSLILFILGLMLLVVWAILYSNRLSNNLDPEWWIWFFLGFGVFLLLIGLIWLIVVQYMVGNKAHEMYEEICHMERQRHEGQFHGHEKEMHANDRLDRSMRSKDYGVESMRKRSSGGSFAHNE